jgi:hypothetical protein
MLYVSGFVAVVGCDDTPTPALPETGCNTAFDAYEPGYTVTTDSGRFTVAVDAASEPDVGPNDWVLTITDGSMPVPGASVVVEPWMPAHGHGITPATYIGVQADVPGNYAIPTFDLIMPGVWEFRVDVSEGMVSDTAAFSFCAEG